MVNFIKNKLSKKCSKCKKLKPSSDFGIDNKTKDKLRSDCLICKRILQKKAQHTLKRRFSRYKSQSKRRDIIFKVSVAEFDNITSKKCKYCGNYSNDYKGKQFCGIDRVDSRIGYIDNNMVPCCEMCNFMKGTLTDIEFENQVKYIYNNLELNKK